MEVCGPPHPKSISEQIHKNASRLTDQDVRYTVAAPNHTRHQSDIGTRSITDLLPGDHLDTVTGALMSILVRHLGSRDYCTPAARTKQPCGCCWVDMDMIRSIAGDSNEAYGPQYCPIPSWTSFWPFQSSTCASSIPTLACNIVSPNHQNLLGDYPGEQSVQAMYG